MFFGGRLKGMPPKLASDDGKNIVIRPLAYVAETDLERWAEHRQYPIIPCTLCGSQTNLQRVQCKKMLREWERQYPGRSDNILHAMGHVVKSHLLDRNLYPFTTLKTTGLPNDGGDVAFDDEPCAPAGINTVQLMAHPRLDGAADSPFDSQRRGAEQE
jgi:tRNA 2-thiocytidine biosynthesis protein TtcA